MGRRSEMYRAVVVDDERYDLEGLRQLIPWKELGIEVICWENRPLKALQFIEANDIDMLITDIKMPVLSGLELAKRAKDLNPALKKLFISGYQDFEFAKQALDLKADGYVLKPVDDHELITTLQMIVAAMDESKEMTVALKETYEWRKHEYISQLLEGKLDELSTQSVQEHISLDWDDSCSSVVLIELDRVILVHKGNEKNMQQQIESNIKRIAELLSEHRINDWCKLSNNRIALLIDNRVHKLEELLIALMESIRTSIKMTVTMSYTLPVKSLKELAASYEQAKELLSYKMFLGKNRIISPYEAKPKVSKHVEDMDPIIERMSVATVNYELVEIYDCMEQLFAAVQTFDNPIKVHHFAQHITIKLQHELNKINESFQSLLGWDSDNVDHIMQLETIQEIEGWLRRTLFEVSETVYTKRQKRNFKLFEEIVSYVEQKLSGDITLREVANYFAYSPNHLGYLFKDAMGVTFNEFLLAKRMEKAKSLLRNHKLKVYEVADQIGYKSLTHFSRTFREAVGVTPGEFRKQSGSA